MGGPWEDYQKLQEEEDGPWNDYAPARSAPAPVPVATKKKSLFQDIASDYGDAILQGPAAMLAKVPETAHKISSKIGDISEEEMLQKGVNPTFARGINNFISAAPDIAMLAGPSGSGQANEVSSALARRSLGFSKRFLNTSSARRAATTAANVALEENVIPFLGSTDEMVSNAERLARKSGEEIGKLRASVGDVGLDEVSNSLETLRAELTKGRTGGLWDQIHNRINNAQESLKALASNGEKITLNDIADTKKRIGDAVNWLSDNVSQRDTKAITAAIERGINDTFRKMGGDIKSYGAAKRTYGAAANMSKALQNEISAQQGNMMFSLPSTIMAAGELASGNPIKAATTLGIVEGAKRRGTALLANVTNRPLPLSYLTSLGLNVAANRQRKKQQ